MGFLEVLKIICEHLIKFALYFYILCFNEGKIFFCTIQDGVPSVLDLVTSFAMSSL
jgi:hypothetical protein